MDSKETTVVKPMWGLGVVLLVVMLTCAGFGIYESIVRYDQKLVNHQQAVWAFQSDIPTCLVEGICYLHITEHGVVEIPYASVGPVRNPSKVKLNSSIQKHLPPLGRVIYRKEDGNLQVGDLSNTAVTDSTPYNPE